MKGVLKAISIQTYGLYDPKNKILKEFTVTNVKIRKQLDPLQGQVVDYNNIAHLLKKE